MHLCLKNFLDILSPYLQEDNIIELCVQKPNHIWVEKENKEFLPIQDNRLTYSFWLSLTQTLAHLSGQNFCLSEQPRFTGTLPGNHRFEAWFGDLVSYGLSISIRLYKNKIFKLSSFGLTKKQNESILLSHNTIITGGTSSGKTSFLRSILYEKIAKERVLVVEDTNEILFPEKHFIVYKINKNTENTNNLVDHILRSRPDIIVFGEITNYNVLPMLRLLNSGHNGFITTLHCNPSIESVFEALSINLALSRQTFSLDISYLNKWVSNIIALKDKKIKFLQLHLNSKKN